MRAAIVAHGQPGAPASQQRAIEHLAAQVESAMPQGWQVSGATLACPTSLSALAGVKLIYPLFMADGWFVKSELPRRLAQAGVDQARQLRPLGFDPALAGLSEMAAQGIAAKAGIDPAAATLLVVGHGSGRSRASADATQAFSDQLRTLSRFAHIRTAFLEEAPFLAEAARGLGPAVCLPYFATEASHVSSDIPDALAEAGFTGPLLPPVGSLPEIPALIAAALGGLGGQGQASPRRCCSPEKCACA